jgi:hypothetical protein
LSAFLDPDSSDAKYGQIQGKSGLASTLHNTGFQESCRAAQGEMNE